MAQTLFQKSLSVLFKQQTNILSAAFVIMGTIILSQLLGIVRLRLLGAFFGPGGTGVFLAASKLPDLLFQIIIAGALSSAFIPVFSDYLIKNKEQEAYKMASTLLLFATLIFSIISLLLFIFTPFFLQIINPGAGFSSSQMQTMAQIMRILIISEFFFIIGTFFSALLQSYNHFFIPGFAAALYNLGVIIGIVMFGNIGIFSAAYGSIIGATLFCLFQIPMIKRVGFSFLPSFSLKTQGVMDVVRLMWPRTISLTVLQISSLLMLSLISYLSSADRNYTAFDYAQTLAFAPILLISSIAQASFPVLSRERERLEEFKATFLTSFAQMFYLSLPIATLFLVLRIPIVRLIFGAGQFDWQTTVLTGRTLAFFSLSLFAQVLVALVSRAFYALHDSKIPLIIGTLTTVLTIALSAFFIFLHRLGYGPISIQYPFFGIIKGTFVFRFEIESIAFAASIGNILNLIILMFFLNKKVNGFNKQALFSSIGKVLAGAFLTGFALYIPIKLLDRVIFDTTRTINLLILTGISSLAGLSLYLFLTWLFNVKEASMFILLFRRIGNWRDILTRSEEPIEPVRLTP